MNRTNERTLEYDGIAWLLERLPPAPQYVELFGDAVAVSVAREPHGVDTINDPTNSVRAFFAAVRDSESELVKRLSETDPETILERVPRANSLDPEYDLLDDNPDAKYLDLQQKSSSSFDLIDYAAAFFIRSGGLHPLRPLATTPGRWTFHVEEPGCLSRSTEYKDLLVRLHDVADRLRRIQIEHEPLVDVIDRNDDENALFYATIPPEIEGTDTGHQLIEAVQNIDSKVALVTSGWNPDRLTSSSNWQSERVPSTASLPTENSSPELYCNFEICQRNIEFEKYTPDKRKSNQSQVGIGHFSDGGNNTTTPLPPGGSASVRGGKLLPFRWYGGKFTHLKWLLPLLPECETFVEPFGGSGAVLINRKPSPTEVYNDIDEEVTSFLRLLKGANPGSECSSLDQTQTAQLLRKIALSPFSRAELAAAAAHQEAEKTTPPMERARQFFIRAGQTRSGLAQEASAGRWAYCKSTSRRTMSGAVSRWHGRLDHLYLVAERLENVQIRNGDALEVIQEYGNNPDTVIYCDPPYPHETRGDTNSYGFELDEQQHRELATALKNCEAKVALSSYKSDLYRELYEEAGWNRFDSEEQTMHTTKDTRVESVWMNYEPSVDS